MATLYLLEQGAKLEKESKRLLVRKDDRVLQEIPEFKIDRVLIFGNVQITTQAMRFLLESGIETSFFTMRGRLIGRLMPSVSKNVFLRMAQFEKARDEQFRLHLAKILVEGKIRNARILLQRYSRNHPEVNLDEAVGQLDGCLDQLKRKTRVSSVLGVEGRAAAVYFGVYGKMFRKELQFTTRSRRPPKDPVNALLSLGYSLITSEMFSVVTSVGFDPYVGYLHGMDYGRPSLALDLVEEFRQTIVDRLTLGLVNKEILTVKDFEQKENGVSLTGEALRKYFRQYENRMMTAFQEAEDKGETNYRRVFLKQVQNLAKTVQENHEYGPFRLR